MNAAMHVCSDGRVSVPQRQLLFKGLRDKIEL